MMKSEFYQLSHPDPVFPMIIESCSARALDPWVYLRDVLTRLPTMINKQVKDVTPNAWAEARKIKQQAA
jgi:transposase